MARGRAGGRAHHCSGGRPRLCHLTAPRLGEKKRAGGFSREGPEGPAAFFVGTVSPGALAALGKLFWFSWEFCLGSVV